MYMELSVVFTFFPQILVREVICSAKVVARPMTSFLPSLVSVPDIVIVLEI